MIYFKEGNIVSGYIPFFKKEYTTSDMKNINKNSYYQLSNTVMFIAKVQNNVIDNGEVPSQWPILSKDIILSESFEYFTNGIKTNPDYSLMRDKQINEMKEIINNLSFYKVIELEMLEVKGIAARVKEYSYESGALTNILQELSDIDDMATNNTLSLKTILGLLKEQGLDDPNVLMNTTTDEEKVKELVLKKKNSKIIALY